MNILFTLRKLKSDAKKAVIYVRVTESTQRFQWSLDLEIAESQWNQDKQRIKGSTADAEAINIFLEGYRFMLLKNYGQLLLSDAAITVDGLKHGIKISKQQDASIGKVLEHFKKIRLESGNLELETKRTTLSRTNTLVKYFKKHKQVSLDCSEVDDQFIEKVRQNMIRQGYKAVYINRLVKWIKAAIKQAYADKIVPMMPTYVSKGLAEKEKEIVYLTSEELKRLATFDFPNKRHEVVRDIWLFQCYTAMSYIDMRKFRYDTNIVSYQGTKMLVYCRNKTGRKIQIPVFPAVEELLKKYNYKLPIRSNPTLNLYIKECCKLAGINKHLTTHVARKTAATLWLELNIPQLTVSKMLGHANANITAKYYAKVTERKMLNDTKILMLSMEA